MTALQQIPIYVYVLFVVLMGVGVARCFPRSIRVERLALLPALIVVLGVRAFLQLFPSPGMNDLAAATAGLAAGMLMGWHHARGWAVQLEPERRRLTVPGDVLMLGIILSAFGFEFVLHFAIAIHAAWIESPLAQPVAAGIWAWLGGMTAGRNANLGSRYRDAVRVARS